jgi:hypothetical protein
VIKVIRISRVIDKCAAVIFFTNVNTNKANSSPQMDLKSNHLTLEIARVVFIT